MTMTADSFRSDLNVHSLILTLLSRSPLQMRAIASLHFIIFIIWISPVMLMQCNYNTVWVLLNFVSTQDVLV